MPQHSQTATRLLDKIGTAEAGGFGAEEAAGKAGQSRIPGDVGEDRVAPERSSHDRAGLRLKLLQIAKMVETSGEHGLVHKSRNDDVTIPLIAGRRFVSHRTSHPSAVVS
jgi:hypothetical protein